MNTKKDIAIGFVIGLLANVLGTILYILLFSDLSIKSTFLYAKKSGYLGGLVALGAILNFVPFFRFLKTRKDYRAKGVLIATLCVALLILIYKINGI